MGQIKLRAAKESDLPRLRELWQESFADRIDWNYFEENCFTPDSVTSSLVLLDDGVIQSMVFFLPTFWYDANRDAYAPAPCLAAFATSAPLRHKKYASWLIETACDFMVEKGAGGVWTVLEDDALELFFSMQGFWTMESAREECFEKETLPQAVGAIQRVEPEDYDKIREMLLCGKSHVVAGEVLSALQRDMAERQGGGMFLMDVDGTAACAIVSKRDDAVLVHELLCAEEKREGALALLAKEVSGQKYVFGACSHGLGMLRLMNRFLKMEQPEGYLGCGTLM